MLIGVGCGLAEIDAVTTGSEPSDFTQSDSQISNSVLSVNRVPLPSVCTWVRNIEVFDQDMAVLVAMRCLKARRGIGINSAEIETFSIGAFNAKVAEGHVGRGP